MLKNINQKGATLIEVLVSVTVVAFLTLTIYTVLTRAVSSMGESKQRVGAIAIANEKMEIMRNLDYEELGIIGGIINGPMLASETVTRNGFDYDVSIDIRYVDDDFDGSGVADLIPTDYKLVQVTVEWDHFGEIESVQFNSNFVPDGVETNMGGGTFVINTMTSGGGIVSGVNVHLDSIEDNPSVDYSASTDIHGSLVLQGVPSQTYRVVLSKNGYEDVRTYPNYPESSFTPVDIDFYVAEGSLNSKNFLIDEASDLTLKAVDAADGSDISGVEINLKGGKEIGSGPVTYNLDDTSSTDSNGEIDYNDISGGTYEIVNWENLGVGDYEFVGTTAETNFELEVGADREIELKFADRNTPSLFVSVFDSSTDEPIKEIDVGVIGVGDFDQGQKTGENGTVFFPEITDPLTPMENGEYIVDIKVDGYSHYSETITVNDLTKKEVKLSPN